MSDLTAFRDHARAMSTAEHLPTCVRVLSGRYWAPIKPDPECPGCVTDDDRALWARLADEVDGYLDPHPVLWEDA